MSASEPSGDGEVTYPYFADKSALIFGGGKGIGRAVAVELARRGSNVTVADVDEAAATEVATDIIQSGGQAFATYCDVLNQSSIEVAAHFAQDNLGLPDFIINNVGAMLNGHPEDIPFSEWQRMIDLNYFSTVRSMQVFLPEFMQRGHGHIVNTASFAGLYPYAVSRLPYAAAKGAIIAMTQSLALYLEPKGIRVSCFIPGPVMTGIMDSMTSWTPNCTVIGPGADLKINDVATSAAILADGMSNRKIMIATDENVWPILAEWARSPDDFLRAKMDAFDRGDYGRPSLQPR
jgi:NAD(P)-dependent dehydrogenase (short-subunit alcohol dehydrogenase family)